MVLVSVGENCIGDEGGGRLLAALEADTCLHTLW